MIYEYALDPALLNNWKDVRFFKDSCGIGMGRLISEYPHKWERHVFEVIRLSTAGDVEKKRMKEALRNIMKYKTYRRTTTAWDDGMDWLSNALKVHGSKPFRAIVAGVDKSREGGQLLCAEFLDETNPLWQCDSSTDVFRTAAALAGIVKPMLELASVVIFIDPHMDPSAGRYRRPIVEFLKIIAGRTTGVPLQRLEFHVSDKWEPTEFKRRLDSDLKPLKSTTLPLSVIRWKEEKMHNRYILTNVGLLQFGNGLDEGHKPDRDKVTRLSEADQQSLLREYSGGTVFHVI
jgi:hypothetical protein